MPSENIHKVGEGEAAEKVASEYEALLRSHPSLDQCGAVPSADLVLLGTGDDGHCGSIYPNSPEMADSWNGNVVFGIEQGERRSIALSMDFMCAAKKALLSAAGPDRAPMVRKALCGEFEGELSATCTQGDGGGGARACHAANPYPSRNSDFALTYRRARASVVLCRI